MQKRTRIWLGIGSAVLVGGAGLALDPDGSPIGHALAQGHAGHMMLAQGGEGGEGGESGEGGEGGAVATDEEAALEPDQALASNLLLMKGHFRVGDQLARAGRWQEAQPHFLHPIEELYPNIRDILAERDLPPFADALDQLARLVRRQADVATYTKQLQEVQGRIDQALASVPAEKRASAPFVGAVAVELLDVAAEEYANAFDEEGKLVNVVEYQDSMGFVQEASDLLERNADAFKGEANQGRYAEMKQALAELRKAWPDIDPPKEPAMDAGEVMAVVSSVELAASGLR